MQGPHVSTYVRSHSSAASKRISLVKRKPSATMRGRPLSGSESATYPSAEIGADGAHPVWRPGRDRDPVAIAAVAQHKVDLADRLTIDPVNQNARVSTSRHQFQPVGAEIRDHNVAVWCERRVRWAASPW